MHAKHLMRSCKKGAMEVLSKNGRWFPVFLITLLLLLAFLGVSYLTFAIFHLFLLHAKAQICASSFVLSFWVFLLAPLWRGLKMIYLHALLFGRTEMSLLFYCYSHSRRYFFAVRRSIRNIGGAMLCFLALSLLSALGQGVAQHLLDAGRQAASLLILLLTAAFFFIVLFCFFSFYNDAFLWDAVFLSAPLLSYSQSRTVAVRRMRSEKAAVRRLRCSFLPLWVLSFLLFGLPLVFVLPYYMAVKAHLAVSLIQD